MWHAQINNYLGYSLETSCAKTPYVPYSERPRQAYIMGKSLQYFREHDYVLTAEGWNEYDPEAQIHDDFYATISSEADVKFLGRFALDGLPEDARPPPGITEMRPMNRSTFQLVLSHSRAVIGLGNPALSPTPWEALCLGVPFIHPILGWDITAPEDRSKWSGQHNAILYSGIDEPYVYHVKRGDREGLASAIRKAMETPIDRYISPLMTNAALRERMRVLIETDWKPLAHQQMLELGWI